MVKSVRDASGISIIAKPLAGEKLQKKLLKLVKKSGKSKSVRRGVKEVQKALRKGGKGTGLCVLAGDISPIDVISHLPILCEENDVPYVYVNSKAELGAAGSTKRPTSVVLIRPKDGFTEQKKYDDLRAKAAGLLAEANLSA